AGSRPGAGFRSPPRDADAFPDRRPGERHDPGGLIGLPGPLADRPAIEGDRRRPVGRMDAQLVGALLELTLKRALGRPDEKLLEAITASGVSDRRVGGCALGVGERDAVVLVEIEAALARAIDIDDEGIQRLRVRVLARGLLRNDR